MTPSRTLISVEEYLKTSFEGPDREYIDGEVVERNLGEKGHSKLQKRLIGFFLALEAKGAAFAFPDQRVQVKRTRFRVPDVCVYLAEPNEEVFHSPPFLAIEILSPEDRASAMQERVDDYLAFGVPFVWVIDPRRKSAVIHTPSGSRAASDGILRTVGPDIELRLDTLFER